MASAKFDGGKCKGGSAAKAMMRHNDISIESRKIAAKENPHIDISKSHLNFSFDKLTYKQRCEKYDKRIKELDETTNTNKRKDRVTMQAIEIPRPAGLSEDMLNDWFSDVWNIVQNLYGAENVIYGDVHVDEVHDYIKSSTKEWETSREHLHLGVVPEVDGVLNGKAFFSRKNMRILNNSIETMTKEKYNCQFMTGEKRKSKQTMDELKNNSALLEANETIEYAEEIEQQQKIEWNTIETEKKNLKNREENLKNREAKFKEQVEEQTAQIRHAKKVLIEKKKQLDNREAELDTRDAHISSSEAHIELLRQQAIERLNSITKLPEDDYSKFCMGWMKQRGLTESCLQDYYTVRGLNDSFEDTEYNNDFSL